MQDNPLDGRRLQGPGNQLFRGIVPAEQVDALSIKPVNDVLDAVATDADADPDAIHPRVPAEQGQLAAVAWLACDGLDLDCPRSDLGHLFCKEAGNVVDVVCHVDASRGSAPAPAAELVLRARQRALIPCFGRAGAPEAGG